MRVKVEMNSKGEVKAHRIEIPIQGGGGELGQYAVAGLVSLISSLKEMKTERELEQLLSMVYGWGACVVEKLRFCYCWREIRHNRGNGQRNTYSKYAGNCGYRCKPD